ncbi:ABC transporter ATP-binding protein, partial [Pseudomonas sp. MWU12-2534b]
QLAEKFQALKEVSFQVNPGDFFGIIGQNGSGKSTLLQIIAGILPPTTGKIQVSGRIAALLELGAGFNPEFTGRENARLNAQILGISGAEFNRIFPEIEAFADIGHFIDQPVKTYSSGMFVRLAFSVQACIDPDILIVDEALAVGDIFFRLKCYERLERL